MTVLRIALFLVLCGILGSSSFATAAPAIPGVAHVTPADLVRGQAGSGVAGKSQTGQELISHDQRPAGSELNYSALHVPIYHTGTSIFQNVTRWRIPAMTPFIPPTGTGFATTGTVTWVPIEGGFFGIISDDGRNYDPLNLPAGYAQDGMRVAFSAKADPAMASFHMWGTIISIIDIYPVSRNGSFHQGVVVPYGNAGV